MKLYRGLKNSEHKIWNEKTEENFKKTWKKILKRRDSGDFSYPNKWNKEIIQLKKNSDRLMRQYFTDNKDTAINYAKKENGTLLQIDPPIKDILDHFIVEFQNYQKRKENFEITYIVRGSILSKYSDNWNLEIIKA